MLSQIVVQSFQVRYETEAVALPQSPFESTLPLESALPPDVRQGCALPVAHAVIAGSALRSGFARCFGGPKAVPRA